MEQALQNIDISYENTLRSIYNISIEEEIDKDNPFFKAMKVPGITSEPTDPEPHDQNREVDKQ